MYGTCGTGVLTAVRLYCAGLTSPAIIRARGRAHILFPKHLVYLAGLDGKLVALFCYLVAYIIVLLLLLKQTVSLGCVRCSVTRTG